MLYQRNAKSMNRWMTPASSNELYFLASTQSVNLCFVPIGSLLFSKIFMSDHIISEVYTGLFIFIYTSYIALFSFYALMFHCI